MTGVRKGAQVQENARSSTDYTWLVVASSKTDYDGGESRRILAVP